MTDVDGRLRTSADEVRAVRAAVDPLDAAGPGGTAATGGPASAPGGTAAASDVLATANPAGRAVGGAGQ
jgi:hypothetical protein